jgi:hypothetical protein
MSIGVEKVIELKAQWRGYILNGTCPLPEQFYGLCDLDNEEMDLVFKSLWVNYLRNEGSVSLPYWSDRLGNADEFRKFTTHLAKAGWTINETIPRRNWAEMRLNKEKLLEYVTAEELDIVREAFKLDQYKMNKSKSSTVDMVKLGKEKKATGIVRKGFAKAGNSKFKYDVTMIKKYKQPIIQNLVKSMTKLQAESYNKKKFKKPLDLFSKATDYAVVNKTLLDYYVEFDGWYTTGTNISDSRGRAISNALKKVFNPISNKDARALLVSEKNDALSYDGAEAVYLFIAELICERGVDFKTFTEKAIAGKLAYISRKLHTLDLGTEEGRDELHENIWLERMYNALDEYHALYREQMAQEDVKAYYESLQEAHHKDFFERQVWTSISEGLKWTIPIEIDATASMLQIQGCLLNHKPFLEKTNVIGETMEDVWSFKDMPRKWFKTIMTPTLYGSSQKPKSLLKSKKIIAPATMISDVTRELRSGDLSVANDFKELIINGVEPEEVMYPVINGECFEIRCNRFQSKGDYVKEYSFYDNETKLVQTIHHTHTKQIPDLEQFRRYFVTLLVHNLDSQGANRVCEAISWIIPIHDAFILHPNDAKLARKVYCDFLNYLWANRATIIKEYFESIGCTGKEARRQWKELSKKIKPLEGQLEALFSALK